MDKNTGEIFLGRDVRASDIRDFRLVVTARDSGSDLQLESTADLILIMDLTNATFAALSDQQQKEEKFVIIVGVIGAFTLIVAIIIIAIILILRSSRRRRRSNNYGNKLSVDMDDVTQALPPEDSGKGEGEKAFPRWRGSDPHVDSPGVCVGEECPRGKVCRSGSTPDVIRTASDDAIGKRLAQNSRWGDVQQGQKTFAIAVDPYRKQEFYTFCKVGLMLFSLVLEHGRLGEVG